MKKAIFKIFAVWAVTVLLMAAGKPLFMAVHQSAIGADGIGDWIDVLVHGLAMDCSMAGYVAVIPAILAIASLWGHPAIAKRIENIYYMVVAALLAIITVADLSLYAYWDFRLDTTPLFYLTSSPSAAMASVEWWMIPAALLACGAIAAAVWTAYHFTAMRINVEAAPPGRRAVATAVTTLVAALLFIPIRGGVTVSTMNLSRAYFSDNQRLNHAAINPAFSLLYSATHANDFDSQFNFYPADELARLNAVLTRTDSRAAAYDTTMLATGRPDIYIIIMESFSTHLMPSMGGAAVATGIDSIARDGVLFTELYASSFRTDRALPAILSGFPAQPTTSVMKYVEKAEKLPSIASTLKDAGYATAYYYGGDANFTNMLAYLVSSRYDRIVSDKDFPLAERTGKWGADDGTLVRCAVADIAATPLAAPPQLRVIQTSSSHEPFDVPYSNPDFANDRALNAFAYADSCITALVRAINAAPRGGRSLIVMVPDHLGVYPRNLPNEALNHHVPLILTGGAVRPRGLAIDTPASQTDIAATLLGLLGIDHSAFAFSNDILDPAAPHFAFYSSRSVVGFKDVNGCVEYNIDADQSVNNTDNPQLLARLKARLQSIYHTLGSL